MERIPVFSATEKKDPVQSAGTSIAGVRPEFQFIFNGHRMLRLQLVLVAVLLALHLCAYLVFSKLPERGYAQNLVARFGLDRDGNVPTLFSAMLLFMAGGFLYLIYRDAKARHEKKAFAHWFVLSMVFFFLGLDEATMIHEFTTGMVRSAAGNKLPSYLKHAWIIPYVLLLVVAAIHFLPFLFRLPSRTRLLFIVSGTFYVGSAMGMELIEGVEEVTNGKHTLFMYTLQTVEEVIEMLSIILFNYALMRYLGSKKLSLKLELGKGTDQERI